MYVYIQYIYICLPLMSWPFGVAGIALAICV